MAIQIIKTAMMILLAVQLNNCKKENPIVPDEIRPIVGDFYVSLNGSDNNPGTDSLPFRTIQKAANTISQGKVAVIRSGNYNEFVTISKNGASEDKRIIFYSETLHGAKCKGFSIKGDFVTLDGFDVEADGTKNWTGIDVPGKSNVIVQNCYVHECPLGGIDFNQGTKNAKIIDNLLEHNGQWGISFFGSNGLVQGNEITKSVQYHPKGTPSWFAGNDADGMRIFGDKNLVRGNKVLNVGDPTDKGNIDPHSDGIQTWDSGSADDAIMTNTIIEDNYFSIYNDNGKGIMVTAIHGNPCHHITIRNNIFEIRSCGITISSGNFHDIFIYNNIFKSLPKQDPWGVAIVISDVVNYAILNNITVDCHSEHRKITGGSGIIDYNIAWNSDGSDISMTPKLQAHELKGVDPKFVDYKLNFGVNNYHLLKGSPAIDKGITINDVPNDFDGVTRPKGAAFDIGAFEFSENK
jgi:hypothetical protein